MDAEFLVYEGSNSTAGTFVVGGGEVGLMSVSHEEAPPGSQNRCILSLDLPSYPEPTPAEASLQHQQKKPSLEQLTFAFRDDLLFSPRNQKEFAYRIVRDLLIIAGFASATVCWLYQATQRSHFGPGPAVGIAILVSTPWWIAGCASILAALRAGSQSRMISRIRLVTASWGSLGLLCLVVGLFLFRLTAYQLFSLPETTLAPHHVPGLARIPLSLATHFSFATHAFLLLSGGVAIVLITAFRSSTHGVERRFLVQPHPAHLISILSMGISHGALLWTSSTLHQTFTLLWIFCGFFLAAAAMQQFKRVRNRCTSRGSVLQDTEDWDQLRESWQRFLAHPKSPLWLMAIACGVLCPSLTQGLMLDDHIHRDLFAHTRETDFEDSTLMTMFSWVPRDRSQFDAMRGQGQLPWWASDDLAWTHFRPVAAATHWLDYVFWPQSPLMMHLHSAIWLLAVVALAHRFFLETAAIPWVAGLAAWLFTLDDSQVQAAQWIASRNALISMALGLTALLLHMHWRKTKSRPAGWLAPCFLALSLASGESALSILGFWLGFAVFLDRSSHRWASLLPAGLVLLTWMGFYISFGYGAHASGIYLDPLHDTWGFLTHLVQRVPVLLLGVWTEWAADFYPLSSAGFALIIWAMSLLFLTILAGITIPALLKSRRARFFALGMAVSLLPASAAIPGDRLTGFAVLGACGLLATLRGCLQDRQLPLPNTCRRMARAYTLLLVLTHFSLIPLKAFLNSQDAFMAVATTEAMHLENGLATSTTVFVLNAPSFIFSGEVSRALAAKPDAMIVLTETTGTMTVTRSGEKTLVLHLPMGLFPKPGTPVSNAWNPPLHPRYFLQRFSRLYRNPVTDPLILGQPVELEHVTITPLSEASGTTIQCQFQEPLESPIYSWVAHLNGRYFPIHPPPIHQVMELPAILLPPLDALRDTQRGLDGVNDQPAI